MYLRVLIAFVLFFPALISSSAQPCNVEAGRSPMAELNGPWRFQTGDLAAWREPGFDDSAWLTLSAEKSYAKAVYRETKFELAPAEQVTLLTDGVVEARTASRELFGFERAASLSAHPAAEIAAAAQKFGQEDDITVLSVTRERSKRRHEFARADCVLVGPGVTSEPLAENHPTRALYTIGHVSKLSFRFIAGRYAR